jgi:magnesium transporter
MRAERVDPAWLKPGSGVMVWVDLDRPTEADGRVLLDTFHFHELAVEDALSQSHHPKIETYGDHLYLILHGIDFSAKEHCFKTKDVDFFLGQQFLVTVHPGVSRSIGKIAEICQRNPHLLGEGPGMLMYRIVDAMVDNYRPEVEKLEERLDKLEKEAFEKPDRSLARRILEFKRDIASLRQIVLPQRDAVGRVARREFPQVDDQLADRITSILDAHLSAVSNQLNAVMKVLTIIATLFMPLTVLTGMYGMNVPLPHLPGGEDAQFWWVVGIMIALAAGMLLFFRKRGWI